MKRNIRTIDISNIPGTNCYCDTEAVCAARSLISDTYVSDIRLLGSGNYHYLSYFSLKRISEDFVLVHIDKHPDMQPPAFGDILSCGGWIADCLREIPQMKKVYMTGVDPGLLAELQPLDPRITVVPDELWQGVSSTYAGSSPTPVYDIHNSPLPMGDGLLPGHDKSVPIFISLDKDVLTPEFARCDWDQGRMNITELTSILSSLISDYIVLGIDICGNKKNNPTNEDEAVNAMSDKAILEALRKH